MKCGKTNQSTSNRPEPVLEVKIGGIIPYFAHLIKWDSGPNSPDGDYSIRLGYYRRGAGEDEWRFAGQTTIVSSPAQIKSLLEKTLAKTEWFASPVVPDLFERKQEHLEETQNS